MTLTDLITARGITIRCTPADTNPHMDDTSDWSRTASHYRATLRYGRRRMTVPFSMGSAWTTEPTVTDVLSCLLSDASSADQPFEDWCSDLGFDPDSRRAERVYRHVQRSTAKLATFLGADYRAFLNWISRERP